jgi:uncharacterized protein YlaI
MAAQCLVCDKELVINDCHTPDDGTIWESSGNWGSTVYDQMHKGIFLVAYVCDECLKRKHKSVVERHVHVKHTSADKPWNPGEGHEQQN